MGRIITDAEIKEIIDKDQQDSKYNLAESEDSATIFSIINQGGYFPSAMPKTYHPRAFELAVKESSSMEHRCMDGSVHRVQTDREGLHTNIEVVFDNKALFDYFQLGMEALHRDNELLHLQVCIVETNNDRTTFIMRGIPRIDHREILPVSEYASRYSIAFSMYVETMTPIEMAEKEDFNKGEKKYIKKSRVLFEIN